MQVTYFDVNQPVVAANQGFFTASENWRHKRIYQNEAWEIIILVSGQLFLQVNHQRFTVSANEVLLVPAHAIVVGFQKSPQHTQYYWFHFFPNPRGVKQAEYREGQASRDGLVPLPVQFPLPGIKKSFVLANQVLDVAINKHYPHIAVDYLLTSLLIELAHDFIESSHTDSSDQMENIKGWILSNLSSSLTVSQIATHFEFNPNYLERIFKQATGQTIIQFINNLKMERAQELLLKTNFPIKQIASDAYFNDDKHFMKQFKRKFQLTPSEFRRTYTQKFQDSSSFDPQVLLSKDTDINYYQRFKDTEK